MAIASIESIAYIAYSLFPVFCPDAACVLFHYKRSPCTAYAHSDRSEGKGKLHTAYRGPPGVQDGLEEQFQLRAPPACLAGLVRQARADYFRVHCDHPKLVGRALSTV